MDKAEFEARLAEIGQQEVRAEPPKRTKVAILGFTDSWKLAPFNDPDFEIWGLNELYMFIPRWDRWFEIHDRKIYENDRNRVSDHILKLRAMTCPVYMHQHWDDIPNSVPYPLAQVCQTFANPCPQAKPYLNNSITYMLLLAGLEGFEEIHCYGVDMAADSEYASQRPSCEWALGLLQGLGRRLYIPPEADLLKTNFLYGYEQEQGAAFDAKLKAREADLQAKLESIGQQMGQLSEAQAQYRGAIQDTQHIRKNWKSGL